MCFLFALLVWYILPTIFFYVDYILRILFFLTEHYNYYNNDTSANSSTDPSSSTPHSSLSTPYVPAYIFLFLFSHCITTHKIACARHIQDSVLLTSGPSFISPLTSKAAVTSSRTNMRTKDLYMSSK